MAIFSRKVITVLFFIILMFSCSSLLCMRGEALPSLDFTTSDDVLVLGGDDGEKIWNVATDISLEMENIDEDLFWLGTQNDVDALYIRTLDRSGQMDAVFHLP